MTKLTKAQLEKRKKRRHRNKPPKLSFRRHLLQLKKEHNHAA